MKKKQDGPDRGAKRPCLNNANCINLLGDFFCACPSGTDGKRCETAPTVASAIRGMNDGQCCDFGSGLNCTCDPAQVEETRGIRSGNTLVWGTYVA